MTNSQTPQASCTHALTQESKDHERLAGGETGTGNLGGELADFDKHPARDRKRRLQLVTSPLTQREMAEDQRLHLGETEEEEHVAQSAQGTHLLI